MEKKTPPARPSAAQPAAEGRSSRAGRHRFAEGETTILPLAQILRKNGAEEEIDVEDATRFESVNPTGGETHVTQLTPAQMALLQRTAPEPTVIARRPTAPPSQQQSGVLQNRPPERASQLPAAPRLAPKTQERAPAANERPNDLATHAPAPGGLIAAAAAARNQAQKGREELTEPKAQSPARAPSSAPTMRAPAESALAKAVEEAVREVQPQTQAQTPLAPLQRSARRISNHVVVFFACKGGVGTTALSLNAAHASVRNAHSTCVVDMDMQLGDVLAALGLTPKLNIAQCCQAIADKDPFSKTLLPSHPSGISVISQVGALDDLDKITPEAMATLVDLARQNFEAVIVDGVRDFSDNVLAVLDVADKIAIVTVQEVLAIRRARWVFGILRKIGFEASDLTVVVNRADVANEIPLASIQAMFAPAVVTTVPPGGQLVTHSLNRGVPLKDIKAQHPVSISVGQLTEHVLYDAPPPPLTPPPSAASEKKPGIFSKIFHRKGVQA